MGSNSFYREERPVRPAFVEGFWIDIYPVTNAEFRKFVEATGYVTYSERPPNPAMYPDADPGIAGAGLAGVREARSSGQPAQQPRLVGIQARRRLAASARARSSSIAGRDDHPVVHVAYEDALAYAAWAARNCRPKRNGNSPPAAGWKARPIHGAMPPIPKGGFMANTWQGHFPARESRRGRLRGHFAGRCVSAQRLRPVRHGRQCLGMDVEPVWRRAGQPPQSCCHPNAAMTDPTRRVVKGGSHLCAPNYCLRYRPSARQGETVDSSTCHIGFRCVVRKPPGS